MVPSSTAQITADRTKIYRALGRRNLVVGVLRIAVPVVGVAVLGMLLAQITLANLARNVSIAGVRVKNDALVIDTPQYAGVMANGTRYQVTADAAAAALSNSDIVALEKANVDLVRTDGYRLQAEAENAQFRIADQVVEIADLMEVVDSRGMRAKLLNSTIDWTAQTLIARDNIYAIFADGSTLTGAELIYDAGAQTWTFSAVKLTLAPEGER